MAEKAGEALAIYVPGTKSGLIKFSMPTTRLLAGFPGARVIVSETCPNRPNCGLMHLRLPLQSRYRCCLAPEKERQN